MAVLENRQKLAKTLARMSELSPSQGLIHALIHAGMYFGLVAAIIVFWQRDARLAVIATVPLALVYTAILVTSHDCIHRTYTGLKWFDDNWPIYWTATMYWPHRTYSEIHKIHHALLGRDFEDPERPTYLRSEFEEAGLVKRLYVRHQWLVNIFIFGGIGFIVRHWLVGRRLSKKHPHMKKAMRKDAIAVLIIVPAHIAISVYLDVFAGAAISFLLVERIGGALMQLRALAEHYGLWEARHANMDCRQAMSARNIRAGWFFRWLFNDLCFHSIHHVYPSIPWYRLGEAHLTIPGYWQGFNPKTIEPRDTYGKVFVDGVRSWRLIDDRAH